MCGIAGFFALRPTQNDEALTASVVAMAATLGHRGPDDDGTWVEAHSGIALGHRRLAIVDLSEQGRQPMTASGGRYVLTYNGEIYNFRELSDRLSASGHRFRGHSDTEVMLAAIEGWGLLEAVGRFNGMFAFALWDRQERQLHLGRDRLGEKPLYYGWMGDTLVFGSELKALRAHPDFAANVDRAALALYFRHNCVPAPHTIYAGVRKLPPGTMLTIDSTRPGGPRAAPVAYWSARRVAEAGRANPLTASPGELVDELDHRLRDAVGLRMHADVPLGAFLSGGIDSSAVVALMQAQTLEKVRTFTIGFDDPAYDESRFAAPVARHLGTDHVDVTVTPREAMEVIPRLASLYDEPFADSSQIPTFLVSQLARRDVTVTLSGDGGDELFAGYNRYAWCRPLWDKLRWLPRSVRNVGAEALRSLSPSTWEGLYRRAEPLLPARLRVRNPGMKIQKLAQILPAASIEEMYLELVSHWNDATTLVGGVAEAQSLVTHEDGSTILDPVDRMMYLDLVTFLPDDILVKVDRATMGVGLEARVPMLDHHLVEFAWKVPTSLMLRDGRGKWLLRQMLYRYVPQELVERPKAGFGLPIGDWLRGPLRGWAEDLLDPMRLEQDGLLEPTVVRTAWEEHLGGHRDLQDRIWDVLMFQAWLGANR